MAETTTVQELPVCNFCLDPAEYDFRTSQGSWAYGCDRHWRIYRAYVSLGTGKGQRLMVETSSA